MPNPFISAIPGIGMHRYHVIGERIPEEDRKKALSALPPEVRDAYLDVTRSHRRLLERLAQR